MIKVIIPEDCFILFNCGLVHCGTPSWFIDRGDYGRNTRAFFTIVEKDFYLNDEITIQKKIGFVKQTNVTCVLTMNTQPMKRMVL